MKKIRLAATRILSIAPLILGGCGESKATSSPAVTSTSDEAISKERAQLTAALEKDGRKLSELESRYKATSDEQKAEAVADKAVLAEEITMIKARIDAQRSRLAELK